MESAIVAILVSVISSAICGGFAGFITVAVLKNDIQWIKDILDQHGKRIREVEIKSCLAKNSQ